jgi:hypothetical protein
MSFISKIVFRPLPGKTGVANERIQRLSEISTRAGARVRVARVVWGDGAGLIQFLSSYASMAAGAKAVTALYADPAYAEMRAQHEKEPSVSWEGPEIWRSVFGEPQPNYPVMLQREYELDRRHLKSALALLPEIQATQGDSPVVAVVPVIAGDMARLMVAYYAPSLVEAGERMDRTAASEAFQAIVLRAAEFGKLTRSRLLVNI